MHSPRVIFSAAIAILVAGTVPTLVVAQQAADPSGTSPKDWKGLWLLRGFNSERQFANRMKQPITESGQTVSVAIDLHDNGFRPSALTVPSGRRAVDGTKSRPTDLRGLDLRMTAQQQITNGWRAQFTVGSNKGNVSLPVDVLCTHGVWRAYDEGVLEKWAAHPKPPAPLVDLINVENHWTVFVVHGTYGGTGQWLLGDLQDQSQVSFGRLLKEGMAPLTCDIEPFPWRSSVMHDDRMEAAKALANSIDDPRLSNRRIVLVGHSHGGNVCLAAANLCKRRIDTVVCLGTPHVHILLKKQDDSLIAFPVYCTPKAKQNISNIITIGSRSDSVQEGAAALRKGVSEQQALASTEEWQRMTKFPRLAYDSGPYVAVVEDLIGFKFANQIAVSKSLPTANHEFELISEIEGKPAHHALHSCRMGMLLGNLIADGFSDEGLKCLSETVVPIDSDAGEPMDRRSYIAWCDKNGGYTHSGWILESVETKAKAKKRTTGALWDDDGSWPDIMLDVSPQGRTSQRFSSTLDQESGSWKTHRYFPISSAKSSGSIDVYDNDFFGKEYMGGVEFKLTSDAPSETFDAANFTMRLKWRKAHY